ncbi:glycosyltransferase family 4 protein [Lysobacter arvi]|uniref:Glycosyltransferase family 1 protein n=1 Tax=Lysobacter arvi TaxID=3038776 RepID=A0ABU1CE64_9GAMM|nr:glycosyltransferase family 1 protein [Lysobacter arvi]MDR0183430.1 glycosyltransferase family 1 protein [Lysobacter arvi]
MGPTVRWRPAQRSDTFFHRSGAPAGPPPFSPLNHADRTAESMAGPLSGRQAHPRPRPGARARARHAFARRGLPVEPSRVGGTRRCGAPARGSRPAPSPPKAAHRQEPAGMKIVLDMQGAQTLSHRRGIGRNTRDITRAFLSAASRHEVHLAFTSPLELATDGLLAEFRDRLPPERLHYLRLPFDTSAFRPANEWRRAAASRLMRLQLDALGADWVWHTSVFEGYGEDAVVPDAPLAHAATAAILYDLIPLQFPEALLTDARTRGWYHERLSFMRRADLLTSISEYSRRDAIERAGLSPERIEAIGSIIDPVFRPLPSDAPVIALTKGRLGLPQRFVLYTGGFDKRKNVPTLIAAYAQLPTNLRTDCPLVLAGHIVDEQRDAVRQIAAAHGLDERQLVIAGSVTDEELIALYSSCALFVFPSLLEGFGLPPAEAMACGAPVLCSRATSLPEVIGRQDAMFDPEDTSALSMLMARVLGDDAFARSLRDFGPERVQRFRPESVAMRALEAFERRGPRNPMTLVGERPASSPASILVSADGTVPPAWAGFVGTDPRLIAVDARAGSELARLSDSTGGNVFHALDARSPKEAIDLACEHPGVILLDDETPPASLPELRAGTYLGAGYAALAEADRTGGHDAMAALVPVLAASIGVVARKPALAARVHALLAGSGTPHVPVASAGESPDVARWLTDSGVSRESELVRDIARIPGQPSADDLAQIAHGASAARLTSMPRWFVDVTRIAAQDIGTGVHRVVRSVLSRWLEHPPAGVRIEPVRFDGGEFRYARRHATSVLGLENLPLADGIVQPRAGDVFVGLDWAPESIAAARSRIADWRRGGVETCFVMHDLLPSLSPEYFHEHSRRLFGQWLDDVSFLADRVACVSASTANDYRAWLAENAPAFQFGRAPETGTFPLGVDSAILEGELTDLRETLRGAVAQRPTLLMVGTLEPRKGHRDALDVADRLWRDGTDFNLIVVGKRGWMTDDVVARLQRHPDRGVRLHWHEDVGDRELGALYRHATALLAASIGEGYGLPLIEAARHGLPVIARDIPVFREVMGDSAQYLPESVVEWDHALRARLLERSGANEATVRTQWPTWGESAAALARVVAGREKDR